MLTVHFRVVSVTAPGGARRWMRGCTCSRLCTRKRLQGRILRYNYDQPGFSSSRCWVRLNVIIYERWTSNWIWMRWTPQGRSQEMWAPHASSFSCIFSEMFLKQVEETLLYIYIESSTLSVHTSIFNQNISYNFTVIILNMFWFPSSVFND